MARIFLLSYRQRMDPVRILLKQIIEDKNIPMSDLSKAVGKNHAYIQQFITRGIPAKLPEDVRVILAEELQIDETALGGPLRRDKVIRDADDVGDEFRLVPPDVSDLREYDVKAGGNYAGGIDASGAYQEGNISGHNSVATWLFPTSYIRSGLGILPGAADILPVEGNSMDDGSRNSLVSGDRVIIDRQGQNYRQGGIFAVYDGDTVIIKQVEYVRGSDPPQIICKSLNPSYAPFTVVLDGNAHIIGRVAGKIMRM